MSLKEMTKKKVLPKPPSITINNANANAEVAQAIERFTTINTQLMQGLVDANDKSIERVEKVVVESQKALEKLLKRPIEVMAGTNEIMMPPKATSFRIEYDVNGMAERLIPEYEVH